MAPLSSLRKEKNGEWTESCIGMWSRSTRSTDKPTQQQSPLCVGINLVQVKVSKRLYMMIILHNLEFIEYTQSCLI